MSFRRATCSVLLLILTTGCATSFELKNPLPKRQANEARLAAAEAVDDYPQETDPKDIALTAVIDRDAKSLHVINPTELAYHGVRVWLNQQHVAWLNELPPRRVVHIPQDAFADAGNNTLSLATENVKVVEIEANGDLYRLFGPAMEPSELDRPKRVRAFEFGIPAPGSGKNDAPNSAGK
jgi:hypothetical protein